MFSVHLGWHKPRSQARKKYTKLRIEMFGPKSYSVLLPYSTS